jgi:hypothetical protein
VKKPFVVHPLLVAIFPTLFLYAHNIRQMSASEIIIPMAIDKLSNPWETLSP